MTKDNHKEDGAPTTERRRVTLNCRLTETESRRLKEMATKRGETVTELILRSTIYADKSAAPYAAELKAIAYELTKIRLTLGQIKEQTDILAEDHRSLTAKAAVKSLQDLTDGLANRVSETLGEVSYEISRTALERE